MLLLTCISSPCAVYARIGLVEGATCAVRPGVSRLDHCKTYFRDTLALATAVYPDANVRLDGRGVMLHPVRQR